MRKAENSGDLITADHKVLSEESESRINHRYAVVVQDLATQQLQSYPCKTKKSSQETQKSLRKFPEPTRKPKVIYTVNALEFGKACEELSWNHCTSTPHRSETHGIAERAVRRVQEGTSAVLLPSGLDNEWWADSMKCYCYLRDFLDLLSDGKTPYERRFGMPFDGPVIPCNGRISPCFCERPIEITSIWSKNLARNIPWIFWKGDFLVADFEELEQMDASEIHARRLNAKEVLKPMKGDTCKFPVAGETVKPPGGKRRLRTFTSIRDHPQRGEEQEVFRGQSDELSSPTPLQDDSTREDADAKNDFWSITGDFNYRHHVEPRIKLYMPKEELLPIPLSTSP